MEKKSIVIVGSANTDMVMTVDSLPKPGETIMANGFMTNHGGKGANQAVAVARLGGNTAFIGKVGADSLGADTIASLKDEDINVSYLTISADYPSGTAFILVDTKGENSIVVNAGANGQLTQQDIYDAKDLLSNAAIVLMQLETPIDALTCAASVAKKYGAYVVLNPAPAPKQPLPAELLKNVDLLIPNETEAMSISGLGEGASLSEAMQKIKSMGVKQVVMTVGSKGALTEIDGQEKLIPSFKVKTVDTTAAGDTFCGGLCVALSDGKPLEEAILFANKAASITVTRMGAQQSIPYLQELK